MKKLYLLGFLILLGLALVLLSAPAGYRLDRFLYPGDLLLSQASEFLERGDVGKYESTLKDYVVSDDHNDKLRSLALYNLGNLSVEKALRGDPGAGKDALFYFKEALRNNPNLFPAKYNLELLLKASKSEEKEKKDSSPKRPREEEEKKDPREKAPVPKPAFLGPNP